MTRMTVGSGTSPFRLGRQVQKYVGGNNPEMDQVGLASAGGAVARETVCRERCHSGGQDRRVHVCVCSCVPAGVSCVCARAWDRVCVHMCTHTLPTVLIQQITQTGRPSRMFFKDAFHLKFKIIY